MANSNDDGTMPALQVIASAASDGTGGLNFLGLHVGGASRIRDQPERSSPRLSLALKPVFCFFLSSSPSPCSLGGNMQSGLGVDSPVAVGW